MREERLVSYDGATFFRKGDWFKDKVVTLYRKGLVGLICTKNESKVRIEMKKKMRVIVAFILNLFPGLGFYFSGTVHSLKWLRLFGMGLASAFLILLPTVAIILHPTPLINYHFTATELMSPSVIALVSGVAGAGVEQKLDRTED